MVGEGLAPGRTAPSSDGCAYIVGEPIDGHDRGRICGHPRRAGSPYCPQHHARCHLPGGSAAEAVRLRAVEKLAAAVGGRRGSAAAAPPARFLARLERLTRDFS